MADPSRIGYRRLIERVNLYCQGIMPNSIIQTWYNRQRRRPVCVTLKNDETWVNPPDVTNRNLTRISDVNGLTPGRLYLLVFFKGQEFEEEYLYEGEATRYHIADTADGGDEGMHLFSSDSDSDSD